MTSDLRATKAVLCAPTSLSQQAEAAPRSGRTHRLGRYLLAALAVIVCLALAAPPILSHTLLVRAQLARVASGHGFAVDVGSVRVGWFKPLRLSGVRIEGESLSNKLRIDQITSDLTFWDLLFPSKDSLGEWTIRGVGLHFGVDPDRSGSGQDLLSLLKSDGALPTGRIRIQDVSISITDEATGERWKVERYKTEINLRPDAWDARYAGVLTDPVGNSGSFHGVLFAVVPTPDATGRGPHDARAPDDNRQWQFEIETRSLPLSVVTLCRGRITRLGSEIPTQIAGEATGVIRVAGYRDGAISSVFDGLELGNVKARDPINPAHVWSNRLACVDGELTVVRDKVFVRDLRASTDFASASIDGALARFLTFSEVCEDPSKLLSLFDGTLGAEIDLASCQQSLPGVLPLPSETKLDSGKITLTSELMPSKTARRRRFALKTQDWCAHTQDRNVALEPIDFNVIVSHDANGPLSVDEFQCHSEFAKVVGSGDMQHGRADLDIDLGRLEEWLRLVTDMSDATLGGSLHAKLRWNMSQADSWELTASAEASNLKVGLNDAKPITQGRLSGQVDLLGRWGSQNLEELSEASMRLLGENLDIRAELTGPVRHPTSKTPLPMRIDATGRIESLYGIVHSWIPETVHGVEGRFDLKLQGYLCAASGRLIKARLDVSQPRVAYENRWFRQDNLKVDFDGKWAWPSGDFEAKVLRAQCEAITVGLRGRLGPQLTDFEIAWRAKLDRISGGLDQHVAVRSRSDLQPVNFRPAGSRLRLATLSKDWCLHGDSRGKLAVRREDEIIKLTGSVFGENLMVLERLPVGEDAPTSVRMATLRSQSVSLGERTPLKSPSSRSSSELPNDLRVVWAEPELKLDLSVSYDPSTRRTVVDTAQVVGDWFATTLSGQAIWDADQGDASLAGQVKVKLPRLGRQFSKLTGMRVHVEGTHVSPLKVRLRRDNSGSTAVTIDGTLGWESGEVGGVSFGPASIPVRLSETSLQIAHSVVPAGDGRIFLAGEVQYRPGPITIRLQPGVVAESIQLTEEMTDTWMKFVAPPIQRVEKIHGTIGVEIDEATIVVGAPDQTRVAGRVLIHRIQMSLTPLMQQLMSTLDRMEDIASGNARKLRDAPDRLITMPTQTVDFDLNVGYVNHKRILFEVGKTPIVCNGYVTLDGRLAMIAKVPKDYFSSDGSSQSSTDEFVSLPIAGTINQPMVNLTGLMNVATLIGNRSAFETGEKLLREQVEQSETLIEDTRIFFEHSKKLIESSKVFQDGLQRTIDRARARRQSRKSDAPTSTLR